MLRKHNVVSTCSAALYGARLHRRGKEQALLVVNKTGEAVLSPMIGARPGLIMGEVIPRIAGLAVIFADGASLAFAEVRPPLPPWHPFLTRLSQPGLFRCISP